MPRFKMPTLPLTFKRRSVRPTTDDQPTLSSFEPRWQPQPMTQTRDEQVAEIQRLLRSDPWSGTRDTDRDEAHR